MVKEQDRDRFQKLLVKIFKPTITLAEDIDSYENVILVGNLTNKYDPILVSLITKKPHFLLKDDMYFYRYLSHQVLDLSNKDIESMRAAFVSLIENKKVCIFPFDEDLKLKNDNYFNLLLKAKATIVPFGISGSYNVTKNNLVIATGPSFDSSNFKADELKEKCEIEVKKLIK